MRFLVPILLFGLSAFGAAPVIDSFVRSYDSASDMAAKATTLSKDKTINLRGYTTPGDGGGGMFYTDSSDSSTRTNLGTVFASADGKRLKRIYSGEVNALWFGADPSGSADSYQAFTNLVDCISTNGGVMYLPRGTYKLSKQLDLTSPSGVENLIRIVGDKDKLSKINYTGSDSPAIKAGTTDTNYPPQGTIQIENLWLYNSSVSSADGISIKNGQRYFKLSNVTIDNWIGGVGLTVQGTHTTDIEALRLNHCKNGMLIGGETRSTQYAHGTFLRDVLIESTTATNYSAMIAGSDVVQWVGGTVEGNAGGIVVTNSNNVLLQGIYQEVNISANNNAYMTLSRVTGCIVQDCIFYGVSKATYPNMRAINIGLGSGVLLTGNYFSAFSSVIEFGHYDATDLITYSPYSPTILACRFDVFDSKYLFTQNLTGTSTLTEIGGEDGNGGNSFKTYALNGGQTSSIGGTDPNLTTTLRLSGTNSVFNSWPMSGVAGSQAISIGSGDAYTRLYGGTNGQAYIQFGWNGGTSATAPSITNAWWLGHSPSISTNLMIGKLSPASTNVIINIGTDGTVGLIGINGAISADPEVLKVYGTEYITGSLIVGPDQYGGVGNIILIRTGTITGNRPGLQITQTWNAGAQAFTGASVNITDTASASSSKLMDFQVASASKASIQKDGAIASRYQYFGSGSPEGSVSAPVGSIYSRTDGGTDTSIYRKESGSGNTGWVASSASTGPGTVNYTSYAAGTAYSLTATPAQLDFGTTDPSVTLSTAGTYLIQANVGVKYNGATYAAAQTATVKLRRTNNTAADISNGSRTVEMPVLTTFTGGDVFSLPPVIYTATAGDIIQIFGSLSATPSAGSVDTDSAEIIAVRIY